MNAWFQINSNSKISQLDINIVGFLGAFGAFMSMAEDFFCNHFDQLSDLQYSLIVLANRMIWQKIEASLALLFFNDCIMFLSYSEIENDL